MGRRTGNLNRLLVILAALSLLLTLIGPSSAQQAGPFVSDDFSSGIDPDRWTVIDPLGDGTVTATGQGTADATADLSVPAGTSHDPWGTNRALRLVQHIADTDLDLRIKFDSTPSDRYQTQGILIEQDADNWIRFDVHHNGSQHRALAATTTNGTTSARLSTGIVLTGPTWLDISRTGDVWTYAVSADGTEFTTIGTFEQAMAVTTVGPFAANHNPNPAHTASIDWIQNADDPITDEDGSSGGGDETPPTVSDVQVVTEEGTATITWTTDEPATSTLSWGTTPEYTGGTVTSSTPVTAHRVDLEGLSAGETYHYRIEVADEAGNGAATADATFTMAPPVGVVVSDDFSSGIDPDRWTVIDPLGDGTVTATGQGTADATADLSVPAGTSHDPWGTNRALRLVQHIADTDLDLRIKFDSTPSDRYQTQGLLVEQDADNWIRFDVHHNGTQHRALAATTTNGSTRTRLYTGISLSGPSWLDISRVGDVWTYAVSTDGLQFTTIGSFEQALTATTVGPFAANHDPNPAHTAVVDWIQNADYPITDEDGQAPPPPPITYTVAVDVSGNGSVSSDPEGPEHEEGTLVTLSAYPDPGWQFDGWSGDVDSTDNPVQVVADTDLSLIATFVEMPQTALVSDDFSDGLVADRWVVVDPLGDGSVTTSGQGTTSAAVDLAVPAGTSHDPWRTNRALQLLQPVTDDDLAVEIGFLTVPSERYQVQGMMVVEDDDNWLRIDAVHVGHELRLFAGSTVDGRSRTELKADIVADGDMWLQVRRAGDTWTVDWSDDGVSWDTGGSFVHAMGVTSIGPFSANHTPNPAFTAVVDYVMNLDAPLATEDGEPWNDQPPDPDPEPEDSAPVVTTQPTDATADPGETATFSVEVAGTPAPTVQWLRDGVPIHGAMGSRLRVAAELEQDGAVFVARASNSVGTVDSDPAVLHHGETTTAPWWSADHDFRISLEATPEDDVVDALVVVTLDLPADLADANAADSSVDVDGLRLVEVDTDGLVLDEAVAFQFDELAGPAAGELVVQLAGPTSAGTTRSFHLYVATGDSGLPPQDVPPVITVTETTDEGMAAVRLATQTGEWFYQLDAGAFSSLLDTDGNDWISWSTAPGAQGEYRGIPNLVYPAGSLHPGATNATSVVHGAGPLRATVETVTDDGWSVRWDITGTHAEMTVLEAPASYWFLYQGTPGGSLEPHLDTVTRPGGVVTSADEAWAEDLAGVEHVVVTDGPTGRSLFVAGHADDVHPDSYRQMADSMTVLGLGRDDLTRHLSGSGVQVSVGLVDGNADVAIAAAVTPVAATADPPQPRDASSLEQDPPGISAVVVDPAETSATVTWSTDEPASGVVSWGQAAAGDDGTVGDGAMVGDHLLTVTGLQPGTTYHYTVGGRDAAGNNAVTAETTFTTPGGVPDEDGPTIDVWYGDHQEVGRTGSTQVWTNVLGNVSDPDGVASLTYTLDGGLTQPLSIGPDLRRLQHPGDFNVEIDNTALTLGEHVVVLTATDGVGATSTRTVVIERVAGASTLPFVAPWTAAAPISTVGHVVDGLWSTSAGVLRPSQLGYDRVVALGDTSWTNMDVVVPFVVHGLGPDSGTPQSGAPLVGLGLRWRGHTNTRGEQPSKGFWPIGAYTWFRWQNDGRIELYASGGSPVDKQGATIEFGTTYMMHARATTVGVDTTYQYSVWPQGEPEPPWQLELTTSNGHLAGGVALIAHHADVSFGTVTITDPGV